MNLARYLFLLLITLVIGLASAERTIASDETAPRTTAPFAAWAQDFGGEQDAPGAVAQINSKPKGKSRTKAMLLSLAVPGAGEYYLGYKGKARGFFAAEAASWLGFASFRLYGGWKKDDYQRLARERAGAQLEGKSEAFLDLVGFYEDIDQYNSLGRVSDPERPYLPDTPENHWRWQSVEDQAAYRGIKNRSKEAFRRSEFLIGAMVLGRVVSVIDVFRFCKTSSEEAGTDDEFGAAPIPPVRLELAPMADTRQIALTMQLPW